MLRYGDWRTRRGALLCRFLGQSDVERWADASSFDDWHERTRLLAELIPSGSRVIEFGPGTRILERYLGASCSYVPADLVARGPDTIVLDLNHRPLPHLGGQFDVAVFAGVLEYVQRLPSMIGWLAGEVPCFIASYSCAMSPPRSLRRVLESYRRAGAGWVNSYSEVELVEIAVRAGFQLEKATTWHTPDGDERIFKFCRKHAL